MSAPGRPLIVGNWKMNLTEVWSIALLDDLLPRLETSRLAVDVVVAPSFPCLRAVGDRLQGTGIGLAAQNVHGEEKGPFTGEVSPRMLQELGVEWVIVGHSERRVLFGESDERIQNKVGATLGHALRPILCVGEQEAEREGGLTLDVVERQLRLGLGRVRPDASLRVVVAYEPVWAIGTGKTASSDQIEEVHRMIREQLAAIFEPGVASTIRILYGGSVTAENAGDILKLDEVDGALVGGASLDAARFAAICDAAR